MRLGAFILHLCVTELRILRVLPTVEKAAQLRGEKEDVVFTSCFSCFQINMNAEREMRQ